MLVDWHHGSGSSGLHACRFSVTTCRVRVTSLQSQRHFVKSESLGCGVRVDTYNAGIAWLQSWSHCLWSWSHLVAELVSLLAVGYAEVMVVGCRGLVLKWLAKLLI